MKDLLWIIPALPFLGACILIVTGSSNLSRRATTIIGCGSVGIATIITILIGLEFLSQGQHASTVVVGNWFNVDSLSIPIAFQLDTLSMTFIFVITFVGFLIHVYSIEFMHHDESFARFFAYLNLFVSAMLILVLADSLVLMYMGWEGVGLCSYLLIGFWYQEEKNGYAARKAFIITRIGDTALAIGLFMLFEQFGTLNMQTILTQAPQQWTVGAPLPTAICFLLLGGAIGKSAQFPLQTWLPDAMAGPSPVSALIHAATMVTAGVYLIARMNGLYLLAPTAQLWVGIIGAITLIIAGCSALTQYDLKRVLAYSTISQIGYMFLALGIGAWSSAIFHFMIHAFFKALLFLGAGAVIMALHHEHDMFKMGGLRKQMPAVFATFLIGSASLAAIPLLSAGFFSKDQIIWLSFASDKSNVWFFLAALAGAFITAIYTFRMVFLTFYGEVKTPITHPPGNLMIMPLVILAVLALFGGFIELPHTFGHLTLFSDLFAAQLPEVSLREGVESEEWIIQLTTGALTITGIYLAYHFYIKQPNISNDIRKSTTDAHQFWLSGWGFDTLYNTVFVKPILFFARINKNDFIDRFYGALVELSEMMNTLFSRSQNGVLRWYIMGIVAGAVIIISFTLMVTP